MDKVNKKPERIFEPIADKMDEQKGFIIHGSSKPVEKSVPLTPGPKQDQDTKKHFESRVNYSGPDHAIDIEEDKFNTASNWNSDWKV